jgi:hypothetical protein
MRLRKRRRVAMSRSDPPALTGGSLGAAKETVEPVVVLLDRDERARFDATITVVGIRHMTAETATAEIEIARLTYAEPARERTKQAIEETNRERQVTYRIIGLGVFSMVVIVFLGVLIIGNPGVATSLVALGGTLAGIFGGVTVASPVITAIKRPKLPAGRGKKNESQ